MKILWLAHRDMQNPRAGGAERTIYEVGSRLVKDGHEITLLTGGFRGSSRLETVDGIRVVRYGEKALVHLAVPIFLIRFRYDLVVNDLGHAVPWPSTFLVRKKRVIFFRHLHARSLPGQVNSMLARVISALEKLYPIIYRNAPFVTESTTSRDDLIELSISDENITLIPPGVDHDRFKPGRKTEFPSMVYFGGLRKYKRPEVSIYLIYELVKVIPTTRLYFVGDGLGLEKLKNLVRSLGIEDRVDFMGRLDEVTLADTVRKSWVNIHSAVCEGWAYSVFEASSAGTPSVAYDVPGISDSIVNGRNGIKVKDGNIHDMLDATLEILEDPLPWWLKSRELALEYSWEQTVRAWESLMNEIVYRIKKDVTKSDETQPKGTKL
ncbi:MAG: glycosyltransferase family 4 protein [Thermoplasmataceae archaeon]